MDLPALLGARQPRRVCMLMLTIGVLSGSAAFPENLLLNSSFKATTNHVTPDDWDLHHAAALEFKDLYEQYSLDDSQPAPVDGARVLKVTNSERDFFHLYLLSRLPEKKFPAGDYVFSVYVKADRMGNAVDMSPSLDHMDLGITRKVTMDWQRYSAAYHVDDPDKLKLSPMLALPNFGTYWISAPQLESGSVATPYAPSQRDLESAVRTMAQDSVIAAAVSATNAALVAAPATATSARFEYNIYSDDPVARLKIQSGSGGIVRGALQCSMSTGKQKSRIFESQLTLAEAEQRIVEIPIDAALPGKYSCGLTEGGGTISAKFTRLAPRSPLLRINQWRNTIYLDKSGYQIRGVMVGGVVPAAWYFLDLVEHGINTAIYYPRTGPDGNFNTRELDEVLALANKTGLKIIVGPMVMGREDATWQPRLDRYADLVRNYRHSSTIIGWFIADEPGAASPDELAAIYARFKALDPYRLVFVNWGSDDVPPGVGAEPPGSLKSTDLYSIDYYPFLNSHTNVETYTLRTIRVMRTGALAARPSHSWLQLYGFLDVSREPTGDELNYMAYVNLLFGANYSYFTVRSTAKPTWERVGRIDGEIGELMQMLWFNQQAAELKPPSMMGHYLYSAWKTPAASYLLVLHDSDRPESFDIDLKRVFGPKVAQASAYFQKLPHPLVSGALHDTFGAYATQVYEIN